TAVGPPRRGERANEFGVALGKNPLVVPDAVLQIKIAESRPIASAGEVVALREKVAVGIGVHHYGADAYLVEHSTLRKRQLFFATLLDGEANEIVDQDWIGVAIAADRVRRPLQGPRGGEMERIDAAGIQVQMIGIRAGRIVIGI